MGEEGTELAARVAALEDRVAALEARAPGGDRAGALPPVTGPETLWALEVLRQRAGETETGGYAGSVLFAGVVHTPGIPELIWQEERPVAALMRASWDDAARVLSALGHPIRLEILRRLLGGASTTSELAGIPTLGTSGQLYHHLRELQGAGLVVQRRRNHYAVPPDRVIPCLTLVAATMSGTPLLPDDDTATTTL